MDRTYNGINVHLKAKEKGFIPVTYPDRNCVNPWILRYTIKENINRETKQRDIS